MGLLRYIEFTRISLARGQRRVELSRHLPKKLSRMRGKRKLSYFGVMSDLFLYEGQTSRLSQETKRDLYPIAKEFFDIGSEEGAYDSILSKVLLGH